MTFGSLAGEPGGPTDGPPRPHRIGGGRVVGGTETGASQPLAAREVTDRVSPQPGKPVGLAVGVFDHAEVGPHGHLYAVQGRGSERPHGDFDHAAVLLLVPIQHHLGAGWVGVQSQGARPVEVGQQPGASVVVFGERLGVVADQRAQAVGRVDVADLLGGAVALLVPQRERVMGLW